NNLLYRMEKAIAHADPKRAASLKENLDLLKGQCRAAEEIFRGKGCRTYLNLPASLRADIEGRLFEAAPGCSIASLSKDPDKAVMAAGAVMASLSERMMGIDLY